jgi:hypothetical protein
VWADENQEKVLRSFPNDEGMGERLTCLESDDGGRVRRVRRSFHRLDRVSGLGRPRSKEGSGGRERERESDDTVGEISGKKSVEE